MENYPIDVVIPWVDSSDVAWQAKKSRYESHFVEQESDHLARFRDWGTLRYTLRSIEKNMPWVRKIFLLTDAQKPTWLKEFATDKLIIISHHDYIPEEYLPTFSSHTIELNLHRIPQLAEHFIYFNDDHIVLRPLKATYFFRQGKPVDSGLMNIHCEKKSLMIYAISNNDVSLINEHFVMQEVLHQKIGNWFSWKYGLKGNLINLILAQCPRFPGFKQFHMPQAYRKSTFQEVWEKENAILHRTCVERFREKNGVNQWLMREWQLAKNDFFVRKIWENGVMIDFEKHPEMEELKRCEKLIACARVPIICINDGDKIVHLNEIISRVNQALQACFPQKSSFEK